MKKLDPIGTIKKYQTEFFLFGLAFILRIGFWLLLKKFYFFYDSPSSDVLYYREWAMHISRYNFLGTKTFWGLPLYPYFLAILDRICLGNLFFIRLFHLILGSFNCVLSYQLAQKVFSKRVGILTGVLLAANFSLIFYDWILMPVPLIIFLSLNILLAFVRLEEIRSWGKLFGLGILVGLTVLGDGKFLFFAIFSLLAYWKMRGFKESSSVLKQAGMIALGIIVVLSLTAFRNKIFSGDYILISAQSGLSFYVGNNENAKGYFENPPFIRPMHQGQDEDQILMAQQLAGKTLSDKEVSTFWKKRGLQFIKNHPKDYLKLLLKKCKLFLSDNQNAYDMDLLFLRDIKNRLDFNPYGILFPLACIACFLSLRERSFSKNLLTLLILSQFLITLVFFLTNRHRTTIYPVLIMFEASAILWIFSKISHKQFGKLIVPCIFIIAYIRFFPSEVFPPTEFKFLKHAKKGPILEKQGRIPEAKKQYFEALKIHPQDTNTLYNLANAYFYEKNYPQAINTYAQILKINPIHIDTLYNLAYTYQTVHQNAKAMQLYKKVLALDPNDISSYYNLGKIAVANKECAEAESFLKIIPQLNPLYTEEVQNLLKSCNSSDGR